MGEGALAGRRWVEEPWPAAAVDEEHRRGMHDLVRRPALDEDVVGLPDGRQLRPRPEQEVELGAEPAEADVLADELRRVPERVDADGDDSDRGGPRAERPHGA